jgi:hypothetical protein
MWTRTSRESKEILHSLVSGLQLHLSVFSQYKSNLLNIVYYIRLPQSFTKLKLCLSFKILGSMICCIYFVYSWNSSTKTMYRQYKNRFYVFIKKFRHIHDASDLTSYN